ncbi:DUF4290 domain-containing protein [Porphyromonas miyakawae]|uniref:DUF4290 domain-containing protein n=1 Tax=Porphyromonas miyakawae TaxID=3137470 RepID=A0ABQ0E2P6_9PORP
MEDPTINKYNSKQERLILPAYGRNIQSMVEHCKTIKDKSERQWCAETIIQVMGNIYPDYRDKEKNSPILWNHLAIMANFELDIDYPVEIYKTQGMRSKPDIVEYPDQDMTYRHYGRIIQQLIGVVKDMPDSSEKEELVLHIANRMKSNYITWNKSYVSDRQIFKDLFELSEGKIKLDPDQYKLDNGNSDNNTKKGKKK